MPTAPNEEKCSIGSVAGAACAVAMNPAPRRETAEKAAATRRGE